eukprot:270692-Pelagomonas_calceolata.AAC.2
MRVGLYWLEGRRWHSLSTGMSACIVLRVEWLPKLRSFQLTSGIAEAKPCSRAGLWLFKWILAAVFQTLSNPGNYKMIAVSGVMYHIYANVLKDLVTDWSTLHPPFILRHFRHAAKKLKPRQSPRLHAAFIDFPQAHDTVP